MKSLTGELGSALIFNLVGSIIYGAINGVEFIKYGFTVFSLCFTYCSKSLMLSLDSSSSLNYGTYTGWLDYSRF